MEEGFAFAALAAALWLNFRLGRLASALGAAGVAPADSVLARLPHWDTRPLFTWGFGLFVASAAAVALARERPRLAWIAWSYALLTAVRSVCILLTPLRSPPDALWVSGQALYRYAGRFFTFRNDLFFSAHTAMPFLAVFLYRDRWARALFAAFSIALALGVLIARLHYSIDVAAAFAFTAAVQQANRRWLRPQYRRRLRPALARLSNSC